MTEFKAVIVVPTCRPESIYDFLAKWRKEFQHHRIIVTEDSDVRKINFDKYPNVEAYSAAEWMSEWGEDNWILPRGNAGHRAFGFWKAWTYSLHDKCDMIVTLDDDCYPDQHNYLSKHYAVLNERRILEWTTSLPIDWPYLPRGFPYSVRQGRPVMINHATWSGVPDFDAPTQLLNPDVRLPVISEETRLIPWGTYFPFCGMNVAWRPQATPLFYFLLMGKNWPYDRFDDIWAGVFIKKICDQLRWCVASGKPSVRHSRLSDVFDNLRKEANGIAEHEMFWEQINGVQLIGNDPLDLYLQLARAIAELKQDYYVKLSTAMQIWIAKFQRTTSC